MQILSRTQLLSSICTLALALLATGCAPSEDIGTAQSALTEGLLFERDYLQGFATACNPSTTEACDAPDGVPLSDPQRGEYSISFWFYAVPPPASEPVSALVAKGNAVSTHVGWRFFIENDHLVFRVGERDDATGLRSAAASRKPIQWYTWHHVVGVVDRPLPGESDQREQLRLYLDNRFHPVMSGGSGAPSRFLQSGRRIWSPQPLRVAWTRNPDDGDAQFFWGRIRDVRVWDRALQRDEITALSEDDPTDSFFEVQVFKRTDEHCYRIPSVVKHPSGYLYAFAERRHGYDSELCNDNGNIDIVLRRSEDGGRTWGPEYVVVDHSDYLVGEPGSFAAVHNPSAFVDGDQRLWLLYTVIRDWDGKGNTEGRLKDGEAGVEQRAFRKILRFDGSNQVGGAQVDITDQIAGDDWRIFNFGPGHAVVLEHGACAGRVVVPGYFARWTGGSKVEPHSTVFVLDDGEQCDGSTDGTLRWFQGGATHGDFGRSSSETQVAERGDGSLILNSRRVTKTRDQYRRIAISNDGGITWGVSYQDRTLVSPISHGAIVHSRNAGLTVFANPACHASQVDVDPEVDAHTDDDKKVINRFEMRRNMTVRLSTNGGDTWPFARTVRVGSAGYPDLVVLDRPRLGLLYEGGSGGAQGAVVPSGHRGYYDRGISFASFTEAWVTDASVSYQPCDENDYK